MHLEDAGTTYKAAMDALNQHFYPKKGVAFDRQVFCQDFMTLSQDFVNLPLHMNLTMKTAKSEICLLISAHLIAYIIIYCKNKAESNTGSKYDFPSNKCCFLSCLQCFSVACNAKSQKLPVNLLQNESNEEHCFAMNNPLAKTTSTLNSALPIEFLIVSGSTVNIINQNTFHNLESLMSLIHERSFVNIYPCSCETPLPMLGKCGIEIYLNFTDKRTFATFHVINPATSCILGKSTSELLFVLNVLKLTRYEEIYVLTNSDFKCRLKEV